MTGVVAALLTVEPPVDSATFPDMIRLSPPTCEERGKPMHKVIMTALVLALGAGVASAPEGAPKVRKVRTVTVEARFIIGGKATLEKCGLSTDAPSKTVAADDAKKMLEGVRETEDGPRLLIMPKMAMCEGQRASLALAQEESYTAVELTTPDYRLPFVSSTFHGRDIFSPAAAHLAAGVPLKKLGPVVESLALLDLPRLEAGEAGIEGEVLNVDHFGNIRTSIYALTWKDADTLSLQPGFSPKASTQAIRFSAAKARISVGPLTIDGIHETFSSVEVGQPVALVGSEGGLEISINQGDAAREFGVRSGDRVSLRF